MRKAQLVVPVVADPCHIGHGVVTIRRTSPIGAGNADLLRDTLDSGSGRDGAALAGLGALIRQYLLVRFPSAKVWRLKKGRAVHVITSQDEGTDSEYSIRLFAVDFEAAVDVRNFVKEKLKYPAVRLSTSLAFNSKSHLSDNLVAVGGPNFNRITKLLLERLQLPVSIEDYAIVSARTGRRYEAMLDETRQLIVRDVGLVVVADNPFS
jgi:hypothetical protein